MIVKKMKISVRISAKEDIKLLSLNGKLSQMMISMARFKSNKMIFDRSTSGKHQIAIPVQHIRYIEWVAQNITAITFGKTDGDCRTITVDGEIEILDAKIEERLASLGEEHESSIQ